MKRSGMTNTLDALVLRLYQTRQVAFEARKERAEARAKAGDCEHRDYPEQGPCWLAKPETWCEACAAVMPHYEAYHKAADKAGAALRLVLREGKRMSQNAVIASCTPDETKTATPLPPVRSEPLLADFVLLKTAARMMFEAECDSPEEEKCRYALEVLCGWREPDDEDKAAIEYVSYWANAEAHGRRSRTVQPLVGGLDSETKGE